MADALQDSQIQRLEAQVAELTQRVFQLEQVIRSRGPAPALSTDLDPQPAQPSSAPGVEPSAALPAYASPKTGREKGSKWGIWKGPLKPDSSNSLESMIGGQWLNRIGIVAVLIGLSYFLKLAFENNWVGPAIRVAIGIVAGIGLLMWSERFRRRGFSGFSYSLKAIGIGALYLSLWASFQFYHLVSAVVAFSAMGLVTLTSAALSLAQDSELLAAFALLGGMLTPVLISTGSNHEVALLSYLLLLDLGTFWMAAIRGWKRLLPGSLVGTFLLFAVWADTYYSAKQLGVTLIFATLFFLLYAAAPFVGRQPAETRRFEPSMAVLAATNAVAYFTACWLMLYATLGGGRYRLELGWLMLAVAALYFWLSRLSRTRSAETLLEVLYLTMAIAFVTVAIPIELDSNWISFAWLLEAGVLIWLSHGFRRRLLRVAGTGVGSLGILRLLLADSGSQVTLLLNRRLGLYLLGIAVLALLAYVSLDQHTPPNRRWAGAAIIGINLLALIALQFEITDYFRPQLAATLDASERQMLTTTREFSYSAMLMVYGSALMVVGFWKRESFLRWQAIVLLGLTVLKVFASDISSLQRGYRIAAFMVLGAILLGVSFFYQRARVRGAE